MQRMFDAKTMVWVRRALPVVLGAVAGYAYYRFIGCVSGSCPITGNPWISTAYGAIVGSLFMPKKKSKQESSGYGISKTVAYSYERAVERVTEELAKEGFGILTTVDIQATMKKKLNVDFGKYVILGACNPSASYKAFQAEEQIGLLLPCNVIVYEKEGRTIVAAFDPLAMGKIVDNPALEPVAKDVRARLDKVMAAL